MLPLVTFAELFAMDEPTTDVFVAGNADNPWGRVFGGQVAAQALFAAGQTVSASFLPHSLHTSFVRAGSFAEPVSYRVERVRDGRSFVTRRVVASQSHGEILHAIASFQAPEEGTDVMLVKAPAAPDPESLPAQDWTPVFNRRGTTSGSATLLWLRLAARLSTDDPLLHAAGITFMSDDAPMEAAELVHPIGPVDYLNPNTVRPYHGATLDHSIWFQRRARADEWTLHHVWVTGLAAGRGHTFGEIFTRDGRHVGSMAQEVLLREVRPS